MKPKIDKLTPESAAYADRNAREGLKGLVGTLYLGAAATVIYFGVEACSALNDRWQLEFEQCLDADRQGEESIINSQGIEITCNTDTPE